MRCRLLLAFLAALGLVFATSAKADDLLLIDHPEMAAKIRLDLIAQAKHRIQISTHIFKEDQVGSYYIAALIDAAKRGVEVDLLIDGLGNHISQTTMNQMISAGIHLYTFRPTPLVRWHRGIPQVNLRGTRLQDLIGFNKRLHDKLFIVDTDELIIGDRNIKDDYFIRGETKTFISREVYNRGESAVAASGYFDRLVAAREVVVKEPIRIPDPVDPPNPTLDLLLRRQRRLDNFLGGSKDWRSGIKANVTTRFFFDDPLHKGEQVGIESAVIALIDRAEERLVIENPYIILTPTMKAVLERAVKRKVKIVVYTNAPLANDVKMAGALWTESRDYLASLGADIYEYTGDTADRRKELRRWRVRRLRDFPRSETTIHGKTFASEKELIVSSFNLDYRSEFHNTEVVLQIEDALTAAEMVATIHRDAAELNYLMTVMGGKTLSHPPDLGCITLLMGQTFKRFLSPIEGQMPRY